MNKKNIPAPAFLKESFLSDYLFADVMLSRFLREGGAKILFDRYAAVFGITENDWLDTVWNVVSSQLFSKADTSATFHTLHRLSQLYPDRFSDDELYVLALKSTAMQCKEAMLPYGQDITLGATKSLIESNAQGGDTNCIALLSFLEYFGFFIAQDTGKALQHLHTGAYWNHFFCALMGARFAPDPSAYHEILTAVLAAPSRQETLRYLQTVLRMSPDTRPRGSAEELEKAFDRDTLQRSKICPDILKMISSRVLTDPAKCTIIKDTRGKDPAPPDVPLDIDRATELSYDLSAFRVFAESRTDEYNKIAANLSISDIRASADYKPLLIVCRDTASFDFYHNVLAQCFRNSPFAALNFATIGEPSFAPHKDNTLLVTMNKLRDKNSVLLLEHCEDLPEDAAATLSGFLSGSFRQNFRLNGSSQITLDLSGVLPIVLSTSMPCREICEKCDVVIASELSAEELDSLFDRIIAEKKKLFGLRSFSMDADARDVLGEYEYETISLLLDKAIGKMRENTSDITLTAERIREFAAMYGSKKQNYSFWGGYHNDN